MARYSSYPFTCTTSGAFALRQIDSQSVQPNAVKSQIVPGGAVDRAHVGLSAANPVIPITTRDLLTVFTAVAPSAVLAFTSGTLRWQKRAEASTFDASAVHESLTIPKGVLVPGNLTASQQDAEGASLNLSLMPLYDGTNPIFTRNTSVDLSAVTTPTFVSRYYMGPVYINSVLVPNIERVSIDFGLGYSRKAFNGSPYPTEGSVITRLPTMTFTSTAISIDNAVSMFARALAGTIAIYFQAGASASDRVAAATTGHIKISATAGEWCTDSISVQGNDDGTASFTVQPTAALAVSVASAIP